MGKEEKEEMTNNFDNIKLNLKKGKTEELYRHPEDRSIIFDKAIDIFNHIDKQFISSFPWMYMFLTYKNNGKRVLFHSLRSVPIIRMRPSESAKDSIMLYADWDGDNVDDFFKSKKPKPKEEKKQTWDSFYDKMEKREKKYQKKYKEKNPYIMTDGEPPEKYMAQLRMAINDISSVYVYNSGFEVQTDGPIDLTCIKRSSILKLASQVPDAFDDTGFDDTGAFWGVTSDNPSNHSLALERGIVDGILKKEHFVLPSEIIHIKLLRATWSKKRQAAKNKEVDSWLLGEHGKTEAEINVGQKINPNILF